jgi:intracellular sulfur oxidation DsrE/DsrF family protein
VEIVLCGQSAASRGIARADLLPDVKLALSALTVSISLQGQGDALVQY